MKFVHHPDYTCLAQAGAFEVSHRQLERYTFPFTESTGDATAFQAMLRGAIQQALESRANRGITIGRLHVEIDEDNPGSGRVVDHVAREEELSTAPKTTPPRPVPPPPTIPPVPKKNDGADGLDPQSPLKGS